MRAAAALVAVSQKIAVSLSRRIGTRILSGIEFQGRTTMARRSNSVNSTTQATGASRRCYQLRDRWIWEARESGYDILLFQFVEKGPRVWQRWSYGINRCVVRGFNWGKSRTAITMSSQSRNSLLSLLLGLFLGIGYGLVWRNWVSTVPISTDHLGRFEQAWARLFELPWNLIICCILICVRFELGAAWRASPRCTGGGFKHDTNLYIQCPGHTAQHH